MKKYIIFCALAAALIVYPRPAFSYSSSSNSAMIEPSAKASALGGAFASYAGDPASAYYNPSSLSLGDSVEFSSTYKNLYGLSFMKYGLACINIPVKKAGNIGVMWSTFRVDFSPEAWVENALYLTYSVRFHSFISAGANLKYLRTSTGLAGGVSATGAGLDLGLYANPGGILRVGIMMKNVFSVNTWSTGKEESEPLDSVLGLSADLGRVIVLIDIENSDRQFLKILKTGAEWNIYNFTMKSRKGFKAVPVSSSIFIRCGLKQYLVSGKRGIPTAGAGIRADRIEIDYAYTADGKIGDSHNFSFGYKF